MKHFRVILFCAVVFNFCSCTQKKVAAPESRINDERIIRELETRFSNALASKDLDTLVSLYADNGALYDENNPIVRGKNKIREYWKTDFARPGLKVGTIPERVEISKTEDMAWSHGYFRIKTDPPGNAATKQFEYALVYKKLPDSKWKIWADCANSGLRNSLFHTPSKSNSPYAPLAPLIGLGCLGGCLWFTMGMPIVTVIYGWKSLRKRRWMTGFIVSVSMWIAFVLVAALFWLQLSANYWNLPLRHAFMAAVDTARYGNPVEDTAESVLVSLIVISVFSGLAAGVLSRAACWLWTRRRA